MTDNLHAANEPSCAGAAPKARRAILDADPRRPGSGARRKLRSNWPNARPKLGADHHAHLPRSRLRRAARIQARAGRRNWPLGGSPLHRRVRHRRHRRRCRREDRAQRLGLGGWACAHQLDHGGAGRQPPTRMAAALARRHLRRRQRPPGSWPATCRRGCSASACRSTPGPTTTCSRWRPGRRSAGGRWWSRSRTSAACRRLLDTVDIARAPGAKRTIAITRPGTPLAARADLLLAPRGAGRRGDACRHRCLPGPPDGDRDALTVLVAQRLGEPALQRLARGARGVAAPRHRRAGLPACRSGTARCRPTASSAEADPEGRAP